MRQFVILPPVPPLSMILPGIIVAEIPDMAFGIAAGVGPPAMLLVGDIHDHLGAGRPGLAVMFVRVGHDDVGRLGHRRSDLRRVAEDSDAPFRLYVTPFLARVSFDRAAGARVSSST